MTHTEVTFDTFPLAFIGRDRGGLFIDGDWIESKDLSDEGVKYLTTGNVGVGEFKEQGSGFISEETFVKLRCTEVLPGDILISRLNLPVGRACVVPDLGYRLVTSVDNVIVRPSASFDRRYLVFLLSTPHHLESTSNLARGTTMQRISRSALGRIRLAVPDLPTQRAIADFLDRETARIDLLIEKKQRLVALLGEKRSATVTAAVTGKIGVEGVGSRDCLLVEGGGGVSGKWRWIKLSHAYPRIGSGTTPPDEDGAYVEDGSGTNWVTTSELRESRISETKKQVSDDALRRYPTLRVYRPGSVIFAMYGATIGRLGMLDKPACCNQACCVFEHSKMVSNKYLVYWLQHRKNDLVALSVGGGQPNLSQQDLRNEKVYCPDLPTQRAIVDFLDRETGRLQQIQETTQQSIDRLKEYRSALITAAVTGQINVVKWDRAGSNERRLDALGDRISA